MKRKALIWILILSVITLCIYIAFLVTVTTLINDVDHVIVIAVGSLFILANYGILFAGYYFVKKRRESVKKSFNYYVENLISPSGMGMISFDDSGIIVFVTQFIEDRFRKNIIGKKFTSISSVFEKNYLDGKETYKFTMDGIIYESKVDYVSKVVVIKDVTIQETIMEEYSAERIVLAELEIDNFQQLQSSLSEEEIFSIKSTVFGMLDNLVDKYNLIYRQYVNGRYLLTMNQESLDKLIESKFDFLNTLRNIIGFNGVPLSGSIGIGSGSSSHKELIKFAKEGLMQAQSRGGDQVGLIVKNKKPRFFGSKAELGNTISKVKVKQIARAFEKRLKDKKVKRLIIYGHINADLDAVGSSLGIAMLGLTHGKSVFIQNTTFDSTAKKAIEKYLPNNEKDLFVDVEMASKITQMAGTIVVIVDVAELDRIENPNALDGITPNNIFIFDHHRVSSLPDSISTNNTYIDSTASSASEIVVEMIQFFQDPVELSKTSAQMLLNGIYVDTNQFNKSTSARTFNAAAFLERYGAQSLTSIQIMKLTEKDSKIINQILSGLQEVKPGYFISVYDGEVESDIISTAANEILRTLGRSAAFVIAKLPNQNLYKLSARGIDVNVQIIAELVGGGGHFSAAAAVSDEPMEIFKENVVQAIVSTKKGYE